MIMNKELQSLLTDLEKFIYQSEKDTFTLNIHQVHLILDHIANQGVKIDELKQKNNLAENILYDYLYNDGKITKEKYEQFKGLKEGK